MATIVSKLKGYSICIGVKKLLGLLDMVKQMEPKGRLIRFLNKLEEENFAVSSGTAMWDIKSSARVSQKKLAFKLKLWPRQTETDLWENNLGSEFLLSHHQSWFKILFQERFIFSSRLYLMIYPFVHCTVFFCAIWALERDNLNIFQLDRLKKILVRIC